MGVTYASLTAAQQQQIQDNLNLVRATAIQILRLARTCAPIVSNWNGGVSALVASLTVTEVEPNTSSLAGAGGVTAPNHQNLMSYILAIQALGDQAHIDVMTPAAGAGNLA